MDFPGEIMMKQKVFFFVLTVALIGLLFQTGCKTGEECTFAITGNWQVTFVPTTFPVALSDTVTFSGTTASGTATGFSSQVDMPGTYTVTSCTTVMFTYPDSSGDLFTFNGTSPSDTYMSGTFTVAWGGGGGDTGTWTANKL